MVFSDPNTVFGKERAALLPFLHLSPAFDTIDYGAAVATGGLDCGVHNSQVDGRMLQFAL